MKGATKFRVVKHSMAVFAEEYAVDDNVEGQIEEFVCKMTGVLLYSRTTYQVGRKNEKDRRNYTPTLPWYYVAHVHGRVGHGLHLTVEALSVYSKSAFVFS
jgi:hypothetical protein